MLRHILLFISILSLFFFGGISANAAEKTVETEGSSAISKSDAIRQAQRAAVEEGAGVFIQSQSEVENFQLKKDKIVSRTEGYITRYDVLKAEKKGKTHYVKIRATVSLDKIKNDLVAMKILLESMERPKIAVMIEESHKSMDYKDLGIAATEISNLMGAKGFDLVDKAQVEAIKKVDQGRQALAGNASAAKAVGLKVGAQYVIVGKAMTLDGGEVYEGAGLRSNQASLQVRVIQTQTGLVLGGVEKSGVAAHINPLAGGTIALRNAAKQAVDDYLIDAITNSFQDFINNGIPMKLHITGVKSYQSYKRVYAAVEKIDRVVSSTKEGWNKAGGILILDLRFKGTSEELADILDGKKVGSRRFEVTDFAHARVDCKFR
jgi:hypothetical protein